VEQGLYASVGCPSVRLFQQGPTPAAVALLPWMRPVGDIDRMLHGTQQQTRCCSFAAVDAASWRYRSNAARHTAALLPWMRPVGDIDRMLHGTQQHGG